MGRIKSYYHDELCEMYEQPSYWSRGLASECCCASPLGEAHRQEHDNADTGAPVYSGICSKCKEHAAFQEVCDE